jgi:hypothetical protein
MARISSTRRSNGGLRFIPPLRFVRSDQIPPNRRRSVYAVPVHLIGSTLRRSAATAGSSRGIVSILCGSGTSAEPPTPSSRIKQDGLHAPLPYLGGIALCSVEVEIDGAVDCSRRERKGLLKVFFLKVRVILE